jgi:DNA-3-methyladenine glycosylase II
MKFLIEPDAPFNFELITSLYARFPTQCVDLYHDGIFERVLENGSRMFLARVKSVGSVDEPKLEVEVIFSGDKQKAERVVRWILGADEDLKEFYQITARDKKFDLLVKDLYGLRPPKTPTVFEALIIALTEQQIALPVAIALRKRLVEKYGKYLEIDGKKYFAFPEPEVLARAKPEDIRNLKLSTKKAEYIIDVSRRVVEGELDLEKMKNWNQERIAETLIKIRGLGPWTIEYMMCRGMGRYDALPASDIGLRSGLTGFLDRRERVSEQETREFLDCFGKYKGYAAFYLIYRYAFKKYPQEGFL